jgi:virulence factor Mce-like protein
MSTGSSQRLELRVGALILAGIIAVVMIILISDRISFTGDYRLTAYLKDAGGLHGGSPVTLSGLPIGKVVEISTNSSDAHHPVKVVMEIKNTYRLPRSVTLTLATSGIFGDAYLAFSGSGSPGKGTDLLPTDGTATVLASRGFFDTATEEAMTLLSSVNDVLSPDARSDTKRLLNSAANLAEKSAELVTKLNAQTQHIENSLANLEKLSESLAMASERLAPRLEAALTKFENMTDHADALVVTSTGAATKADAILAHGERLIADSEADLRSTVTDLRKAMADAAALMAMTRQGQGVIGQLLANRDLAKDVNDIAINLVQVSELVLEHPEALVFGQSKEQAKEWQERRDRLRVRRAFQEGWQRSPEPVLPKPTLMESGRANAAATP